MLDLDVLRQLVCFQETGTFVKVAENFHVSTPSITRNMRQLEDVFGVELFFRGKNHISLNDTGVLAAECAKKLIAEEELMLEQVREFDRKKRTITVASCAPAPLWRLLRELGSTYPGMTISSSIANNDEVLEALYAEQCDFAILPFSLEEKGYPVREYMREQLFVCVPKEHELSGSKTLHTRDINGYNFLLRSELGFWDALCRKTLPASKFLVQADEFEFAELVQNSTLPCFTTDVAAELGLSIPGRVSIPLADPEASAVFYLTLPPKSPYQKVWIRNRKEQKDEN